MLYGYPIEATAENWFHECMIEMLSTIHARIRDEQNIPDWPEIIPENYRERLRLKTGLKKRFIAYQNVLKDLSNAELNRVSNAMTTQNEVDQLLSGTCNCESIDQLPEKVRKPAKSLFYFGFELLTDFEIRDRQYRFIYERIPNHICPFCGCEYFDAPGAPREALDHYLAESKYPYAATNLRNLVPMGNKCNSKYKIAQDILFDNNGQRRHSYYPYNVTNRVQVSLMRSEPFAGKQGLFPLPDWQVDFEPISEEVKTWDTVFHINERLKRDILDVEFFSWLREFSLWCHSSEFIPRTEEQMINALKKYSSLQQEMGMRDRAFIKSAVFIMLLSHYEQGNQRLIDLLNGIVIGGMA